MTLGRIGKPVVKQAIADTGRSLLPVSAKWLLIHAIRSARPTLRRQEIGLGQHIAAAAHDDPQHALTVGVSGRVGHDRASGWRAAARKDLT